ncbi:MAG: hypothetical protein SV760_08940, partial [Halobacteria archaeon]|nr:hypothetical protein [Halobacteria archaeon]
SKLSNSEFRENLPSSIDKIIEREHDLRNRPVSVRGDIKVRPEVIGYQGVHDWHGVTELFKEWLRGYDPDNSGAVVLEDSDGNQV